MKKIRLFLLMILSVTILSFSVVGCSKGIPATIKSSDNMLLNKTDVNSLSASEPPTSYLEQFTTEMTTETENITEEPQTELRTEPPTEEITEVPTEVPTEKPTDPPTVKPTDPLTVKPTVAPTKPVVKPTEPPTAKPTVAPTVAPTEAPTEPPTIIPTKVPDDKPSMTREEIIKLYLDGFNYARTHAEENRMGKSYKPVTINETYSKYAQYYAEWLAHNMPNPTSVECHSGTQLRWCPAYEGITLGHGNIDAMTDAARYMVDHIMFYGDTYNTEIGIGAYYKDGVWYVVFQSWQGFEKNFPF